MQQTPCNPDTVGFKSDRRAVAGLYSLIKPAWLIGANPGKP